MRRTSTAVSPTHSYRAVIDGKIAAAGGTRLSTRRAVVDHELGLMRGASVDFDQMNAGVHDVRLEP